MRYLARTHRRFWCALFFIILAGCGKASDRVALTPTDTPAPLAVATSTPTAVPPPALPWQKAQIAPYNDWVFAPSNGTIGYDCSLTSSSTTAEIAITHDRGMHFSQTPLKMEKNGDRCEMLVDANDAAIAVAREWGTQAFMLDHAASRRALNATQPFAAPGDDEIHDFVTTDGGQSWYEIPGGTVINDFVSLGKRLYALICTNPRFGGEATLCDPHFVVSDNGLQSWQNLPMPSISATMSAATHLTSEAPDSATLPAISQYGVHNQLVPDPYSGVLIYLDNAPADGHIVMERSTDGGYSWATIAAPQPMQQFMFSLPGAQHPMTMCFSHDSAIWCSPDVGLTWKQRTITNPVDFNENDYGALLAGIASNGDLVMESNDRGIYRLTSHATAWQLLGDAPGGGATLYGPVGANILWVVNPSSQVPQGDQWYSLAYP